MKHANRFSSAALACALVAGSPFGVPVVEAQTSSRNAAAALRVTGFDVEQVDRLEPGAELNFTVWGTPGATVLLQIDGSRRQVRLDETTAGRYQGSYVVGRSDRISQDSRVHANLRAGNRVATATLGEALQVGWPLPGEAALPEIQSVAVVREPNRGRTEALRYTVRGTPGGQASVQLRGSQARNVMLEEVRPGEYSGVYVLPQGAWVDTQQPLVAQLRQGNRSAQSSVSNAYAGAGLRATRAGYDSCLDCATVQAVNQVVMDGDGKVLGTVAGGVLGAVVGSQFGKGDGRTAAGVAGAVGGALLGREIQKRHNQRTQHEVVVRMNDGTQRTMVYAEAPAFRVGDRVRVVGETLEMAAR
ncbi:glycine zipper 2TM domain-containing protein [Roseateles asaccharophilus]|uniref:Outer membrane lipoprotein SlyB n=1 Tax=Roseateles asaccharophilus TaxID=582607 RepID=A0ABU2A3C0_9BURK|nr:glycine zipper 2TM domain-containing protein [Roseateles asaccharophilus]MDR7331679.1 outer membrane lipoprotein SlyB [Roseateles asaccharophilus]